MACYQPILPTAVICGGGLGVVAAVALSWPGTPSVWLMVLGGPLGTAAVLTVGVGVGLVISCVSEATSAEETSVRAGWDGGDRR